MVIGAPTEGPVIFALAVFDRQTPAATAICGAAECKAASTQKVKPQRISNPNPPSVTSMPSIQLKFGALLQ